MLQPRFCPSSGIEVHKDAGPVERQKPNFSQRESLRVSYDKVQAVVGILARSPRL
ncbi:hypothetical protein [Candidatus Anaplasma sp. TIGMIC]|uniref:hypothetical protein n=1 Tax=Candidatus Anaplasma sp. TIGMIC TaxID=3020713 RepID=UPI00232D4EA7|nr:hypothetical protein [Candidatus Anaplasma sp. TIGMIC]